jgi:ATP-dependent exoDNAse (exonuclease V) alpha subunit
VNNTNLVLNELKNSNVFLTGGAGVGKSYIINKIINYYKNEIEKEVIALGSTGISAVNIGGFTIHSFFVFGISNNFDELQIHDKKNKSRINELKKILQSTDLIIIDEISMVSADIMDMVSYRFDSLGFRGKLLLVGDFFQLPPIQRANQKKANLFSNRLYAFESDSWKDFNLKVIELTQMKRTKDKKFTYILNKMRIGECDREVIDYMLMLTQNQIKDKNPTYLFGRNFEVNNMNRIKLEAINKMEYLFVALIKKHKKGVSQKKIDSWKRSLPIDDELRIKEGVPILFTVNKWGQYVNGERGIVHRIEEDYIIVEKDEEYIRVMRHDFELIDIKVNSSGKVEDKVLVTLSQFPIKLAYAITIHKSQGMSIDNLVCNADYIFAPSQFYVSISRAVNPKNLRLEFHRGDILNYLYKIINVDKRVKEYYFGLK